MGTLKNGHFAQFGTNSYLEGARWHYKVPNFFYRVKLLKIHFSRKKIFWCGNFLGTHLRLKIFDFCQNLKFRPSKMACWGCRSGLKIFFGKPHHRCLKTTTISCAYHHFKKSTFAKNLLVRIYCLHPPPQLTIVNCGVGCKQ